MKSQLGQRVADARCNGFHRLRRSADHEVALCDRERGREESRDEIETERSERKEKRRAVESFRGGVFYLRQPPLDATGRPRKGFLAHYEPPATPPSSSFSSSSRHCRLARVIYVSIALLCSRSTKKSGGNASGKTTPCRHRRTRKSLYGTKVSNAPTPDGSNLAPFRPCEKAREALC